MCPPAVPPSHPPLSALFHCLVDIHILWLRLSRQLDSRDEKKPITVTDCLPELGLEPSPWAGAELTSAASWPCDLHSHTEPCPLSEGPMLAWTHAATVWKCLTICYTVVALLAEDWAF